MDRKVIQDFIENKTPDEIINAVINSVAPCIYGHSHIKNAVACSLFGGVSK